MIRLRNYKFRRAEEQRIGFRNPLYLWFDMPCGTCRTAGYQGICGRYVAKVTTPGIVKVIIKNKKGKFLGEVHFRVKRLPDPIAKIGDMYGGVVNKNKFKVHRGLNAVLENFDYDIKYKTISFDVISYNPKKNTFFFETNLGALFNERVKEKIMNVESDDIFLFDKIKVAGPDGITRELSPITFKINDSDINSPESR